MSEKVEYTITVDKEMFPYPPGSEVVVRDYDNNQWRGDIFMGKRENGLSPFTCSRSIWKQCHPLATHSHLIGTTYPADTPRECKKCFHHGTSDPYGHCDDCTSRKDKPKFVPFQKVLVRDFPGHQWRPAIYGQPDSAFVGQHVCIPGTWRQCIPYEGNEHLLGTTSAPEGV